MLFQPVIIPYFPERFYPLDAVRAGPILYPWVQNFLVICHIIYDKLCVNIVMLPGKHEPHIKINFYFVHWWLWTECFSLPTPQIHVLKS